MCSEPWRPVNKLIYSWSGHNVHALPPSSSTNTEHSVVVTEYSYSLYGIILLKVHNERENQNSTMFWIWPDLGYFSLCFQFPKEMDKLTKTLRNLDLSGNKLPAIPPSIGNFQMLKTLMLHKNRLGKGLLHATSKLASFLRVSHYPAWYLVFWWILKEEKSTFSQIIHIFCSL